MAGTEGKIYHSLLSGDWGDKKKKEEGNEKRFLAGFDSAI